ncbi:hypothetical protein AYL99_11678 [Fonsecaea erecta]|uniref:DUF7730 domain-containing protein n=1 Tax=Fonsecaea erecta TaxID=1367422 RepID=A0A178Z4M7_9EURO|nr:hypothetical protein AYL99_11678 [Fonsecaea erecta]OAP54143.1 hypothetical protein AYL99_11678 [Fonsecaea erecta]
MSSSKRYCYLPHRNRWHILRPIPQPQGPSSLRPQAETRHPLPDPTAEVFSKPFPFFELPIEIRDRIYHLVVPEARVMISANHPQKELELMRQREPSKKHKLPPHRLLGQFSGNPTATALLWGCHQMKQEASKFIYSRTTFCFDRIVVLRNFLKVISQTARESIGALEITHIGYAEPKWMADRKWKLRHDAKWVMVLRQVRNQATALRHLTLNVTFFDWPIDLDLSEEWARPYLEFAEEGLRRVDFTLKHEGFKRVKLAATAKELQNRMMSAEGEKARQRDEKLKAEVRRKLLEECKCLVFTLPLDGNPSNVNTANKKVVRRTGLEQYAVVEPLVEWS